jgi:hypothetical protein
MCVTFKTQKLSHAVLLSEGVQVTYLCDGLIYTRAEVFMWDIELQVMTQAMDGGQASFYLNTPKLPN